MQSLVYSGADSLSHIVMPNQNVGRSWKFHVVPAPLLVGWMLGSRGSVIVYVRSLPEPGTADLNSTDGSSWPTYSAPGLS